MLTVRLLGQFSLTLDGVAVELPSRPAQSLLAWLVLHPGIAHRRERLAGIFWPEATEENAQNNLRHALWRLRRAVPEDFLYSDRIAIRWAGEGDWQVDVAALTTAPAHTADALITSLQAHGGELLPGFYDEWVSRERERVAALYEDRMARLLELLLAETRWREAIEWAEQWIAHGHAPEPAYRALMTAHASQGNSAAALAAFQRCTDALERELDVPPSAETAALAASIHNSQFTIHHSQFTIFSPQFPNHPFTPSNLPAPTTSLVGRNTELTQLADLLTDPAHRLVTILGPGGMGKSRLALAAAHAARPNFPDSVFLVELTALSSADEMPRAIGESVGYLFQNDPRPPRQQLLDYLRSRRLLLLLDNFEHLLDGAVFAVELLEAAPGLRLLVTSRERLHLQAETLFRLDGLAYPPTPNRDGDGAPQNRDGYGATDLFLQSARRVRQEYTPASDEWPAITRICRLVGGMPLGIVLAAGWAEMLSPGEIADEIAANVAFLGQELGDLDPRHRTIEAVFAQSWQRLSGAEQQALMGLSIFAGGFDRQAAQVVAGATLPVLTRLVDRSLLWRVGEGRYDLHELVRQLARQKLVAAGIEKAVLSLHSRWFLEAVARQESRLKGAQEEEAIAWMEMERENVRVAWEWAAQKGEMDLLQQATEALGIFHNRPGQWQEGEALMARAASTLGETATPQARLLQGWLLAWGGLFLHWAGKPIAAQERMSQALTLVADSPLSGRDISLLRAFVCLHRGGDLMVDRRRGESADSLRLALAIYDELREEWWMVQTLIRLGHNLVFQGAIHEALKGLQKARQIVRQSGNRNSEVIVLNGLSFALEQAGYIEEGERLAREALELSRRPAQRQWALGRLAFVLLAAARFEESIALSQKEIEWARSNSGGIRQLTFLHNTLARGHLDLGHFAEGKRIAQEALAGWQETFGWEVPFVLRSVAMGSLALGDAAEARHLMRRTLEGQQQMGNENLFALSGAFVDCAYPALALNDLIEARQMLREGLRLVQRSGAYHYGCLALPAAALLFAQEEQLEDAAFVNGAIQRYPRLTTSRWYATVALDRLAELLAPLPPDVRSVAEERGRAQGLPEMTAELLALLA